MPQVSRMTPICLLDDKCNLVIKYVKHVGKTKFKIERKKEEKKRKVKVKQELKRKESKRKSC